MTSQHIANFGQRILHQLKARSQSIAFAESLTAGYLCGSLAQTSGISAVLRGGVVTYDISAKAHFLGVDQARAESCDAVSEEVARSMALGICSMFEVGVGVSTTGFAEAWDTHKPQAYVGFVVNGRESEVLFIDLRDAGDREACRQRVVFAALARLADILDGI